METDHHSHAVSALSIESQRVLGTHRLRLTGELDMAGVDLLDKALDHAVAAGGEIVVELDELQFIDSRGLQALVDAGNRSSPAGKNLRMSGTPFPQVRRLLKLCGIDELLRFET